MSNWLWNYSVGWIWPEPEFVSVFADQDVERGKNVQLVCDANTENVTATWTKDGRLLRVKGKHISTARNATFSLEIKNVEEKDVGKYSLTLTNVTGSASHSANVTLALKEWRNIPKEPNEMIKSLKNLKICTDEVRELRLLLHGPVGAGKSSLINTIKSIFENRPFVNAPAAAASSTSYTLNYKKYSVERFAIYDVKGLERTSGGVNPDDIINALKGHIKNGYTFGDNPINTDDEFYNISPGLNDKIHCLISVIPASNPSGQGPDGKETFIDEEMVKKLMHIRKNASKLRIPQVVFMTKVDKACPATKENLSKIYTSKKIKQKMEVCSNLLTVPMNCIFPVQNYHEETKLDPVLNSLMLDALNQVVHWANDYLKSICESQKHVE